MSKIERGQFSSLLRRYLGMKGTSDVLDELAPEISATFPLEVERPEWEFLKGQKLLAGSGSIVASPGLAAAVRLRNPVGTSAVGIIDVIHVSPITAAAQVRVTTNVDAGNLATTFRTNPRDTRMPSVAFPGNSALILSGDYGLNGQTVWEGNVAVNTTQEIRIPYVITPGFQIQVTSVTVNVGIFVNFSWLERRLDELETQ